MKKWKRPLIQAVSTVLHNPFIPNFFTGKIYRGNLKHICVPGLNCYSCPGAAGSCPIGSLQAALGGRIKSIPYYVLGLILLFGALFGRLICGFLCPFGFVQDLLHKIPSPKPRLPHRLDKTLRYGKYVTLAMVLFLPVILTDAFGLGTPFFCKYICPAGILEGGIPLAIGNEAVRGALGFLFSWKMAILILIIAASVLISRPFCKYLCPLGAIYGLMNRFSLYQMYVNKNACVHCGRCKQACPMGVDITKNSCDSECIRCGECKEACPVSAIETSFIKKI